MALVFRQVDRRFPFLWESAAQPAARWHSAGEGPVHYFSDTPDGAWAELLRHEEIEDPADLETLQRALWAVEIADHPKATPDLAVDVMTGKRDSYPACQAESRRLRHRGEAGFVAPSAALSPGGARGTRIAGGAVPGPPRDGQTIVLFGLRPDLVGWLAAHGRPSVELLGRVRRA